MKRCTKILLLLVLLLWPAAAAAKIVVFTDGRILKVDDAYLEADRIVLILPDEAWIRVPATRVDRVVADEVVEPGEAPVTPGLTCSPEWRDQPLPIDTPYRESITRAAHEANLHPLLLASLVKAESAFNPQAVSRAGARGLTQLMPAAAAQHGVEDVWDPQQNLRGGATHLRLLLDRFQSLTLALAAYNAGAATVERSQGIPPYRETRTFVNRVLTVFCEEGEAALLTWRQSEQTQPPPDLPKIVFARQFQ
jgi:soluble lytic murein transglycosylase-like protein